MHPLFLGVLLGAVVVVDPFVTAYLLRDFDYLRDFPFVISISVALILGAWYTVRAFRPGMLADVIQDYYRAFPVLFLLAYQMTGVAFGALDPTEAVIGVFMGLFLAGLFIRRDQSFVPTAFNGLHLALVICMFLSLASEFKPFAFLKGFKPLVLFFLLINFLPREDLIRSFLRWMLIFALLSAVFCLIQELAWFLFQELLSPVPLSKLKRMFESTPFGPMFRTPGLMVSYRSMALYQATSLILAISQLLWWNRDRALLPKVWLYVVVILSASALGLTVAKDVLLGTGAALCLLLVLYRWNVFVPIFAAGALAGALGLTTVTAVIPGNVDTVVDLMRTIPKTEQERIRVDRDSIQGFLHGPYTWTGRGVGAGARYTAHHLNWPAHNAFILAAAEIGLLGLVVYLLIYGLAFARAIALCILANGGPYQSVSRALLAILVVVLAGAQFEASYLDIFVWTIFATVEAVWFLISRGTSTNQSVEVPGDVARAA